MLSLIWLYRPKCAGFLFGLAIKSYLLYIHQNAHTHTYKNLFTHMLTYTYTHYRKNSKSIHDTSKLIRVLIYVVQSLQYFLLIAKNQKKLTQYTPI